MFVFAEEGAEMRRAAMPTYQHHDVDATDVVSDPAPIDPKYDCGRVLSPLLMDGWAHSVLFMMILPKDDSMKCEGFKSGLHALSNQLTLHVLSDEAVRNIAIKAMETTTLKSSGTKFSHGLAYSGSDEVLRRLQGSAVSTQPTTKAEAEMAETGRQYVEECLKAGFEHKDGLERTLLHYAMMGENQSMCVTLLNWGHSLYTKDTYGKIPQAYCQSSSFVPTIRALQLEIDAFVSVGHTEATDAAVVCLMQGAKKAELQFWWDKGNAEKGPGIRPGEPWTAEIEGAMKKCKICVVILTKKWLSSVYVVAPIPSPSPAALFKSEFPERGFRTGVRSAAR